MTTNHNPRGDGQDAVTGGYNPVCTPLASDGNLVRLRVIISLFGLGLSDVARAGGVSRPYVSRVLSGGLKPSDRFIRQLEGNLGRLVEGRHGQVFAIAVTEPKEEEMAEVVRVSESVVHDGLKP